MNGKKAKRIRKEIYGDYSLRTRKYVKTDKGTIINHPQSLRAKYLEAKKRT